MKFRIISIMTVFGLAYLFLISHLYDVQINKNKTYEAMAEGQQAASGSLDALRGSVYFTDKNGNQTPAIINKDFWMIYAVPKELEEPASASKVLASALNLSADDLEKKLNKPNRMKDQYEEVLLKATDEQVDQIKKINLKGIYFKKDLGRYYPLGSLASQVLGFISPVNSGEQNDGIQQKKGRYGVELQFEDDLSGISGKADGDRVINPIDGKDVMLSIDRNIQAQAEEILKKTAEQYRAESGVVLVQDPYSGKILAMGSYPAFDPNSYKDYDLKTFLNTSVQALYEPGSVFKPVTMSAGIDSGRITPDTRYTDTGSTVINGMKIQNWDKKAYGNITMTNVIEHSLNMGTIFAEKTTGHEIFSNYVTKFGFGEKSGIALPGELKGNVNNIKLGAKNTDVNFATASFGQGISVTPVQMINAISVIANGGRLMKPTILATDAPKEIRRVISQDTARKVTEMMVSAAKVNKVADIPNYRIAGKSGTAFIPKQGGGGYSNQTIHSYVGFAPAYNPKFVVMFKLEKPNAPLAGQTAAPAFRELTEFLLNYYNISPDL